MTLPEFANDKHKRAAIALCNCLTLDEQSGWWKFRRIIELRLTEQERVFLAFMALKSLSDDTATIVAKHALNNGRDAWLIA